MGGMITHGSAGGEHGDELSELGGRLIRAFTLGIAITRYILKSSASAKTADAETTSARSARSVAVKVPAAS